MRPLKEEDLSNNLILLGTAQQGGGSSGGGGGLSLIIMFGLIFLFMYFFMIRPQQKKEKQRQKMISELKKGDKVLTNSGIVGTIYNIKDNIFVVKVDDEVKIEFVKSAIAGKME
jgi:preprotein translocase subunit YajC